MKRTYFSFRRASHLLLLAIATASAACGDDDDSSSGDGGRAGVSSGGAGAGGSSVAGGTGGAGGAPQAGTGGGGAGGAGGAGGRAGAGVGSAGGAGAGGQAGSGGDGGAGGQAGEGGGTGGTGGVGGVSGAGGGSGASGNGFQSGNNEHPLLSSSLTCGPDNCLLTTHEWMAPPFGLPTSSDLYAWRFSHDGQPLDPQPTFLKSLYALFHTPRPGTRHVAVDETGYRVLWRQSGPGAFQGSFRVATVGFDGAISHPEGLLVGTTIEGSTLDDTATIERGSDGFLVSWWENLAGDEPSDHHRLRAARLKGDVATPSVTLLEKAEETSIESAVALSVGYGGGAFLLLWTIRGGTPYERMYGASVSEAGPLGPVTPRLSSVNRSPRDIRAFFDGSSFYTAFADGSAWATHVDPAGAAGPLTQLSAIDDFGAYRVVSAAGGGNVLSLWSSGRAFKGAIAAAAGPISPKPVALGNASFGQINDHLMLDRAGDHYLALWRHCADAEHGNYCELVSTRIGDDGQLLDPTPVHALDMQPVDEEP